MLNVGIYMERHPGNSIYIYIDRERERDPRALRAKTAAVGSLT